MILYEGPSLLDGAPIVVIATEDENPKTGRMLYTWIFRQDRPPEVAAYDGSDDAICGDCKFRAAVSARNPSETIWPELDRREWEKSKKSRTCYVRLSPAEGADEALPPSEVWRAWKAGEFNEFTIMQTWYKGGETTWTLKDWEADDEQNWRYTGPLPVRIGSYGDPAAVPTRVWAELVRYQKHWTGYTHMWKPKMCSVCKGEGERRSTIFLGFCGKCDGVGKIDRCDPDLKTYCMASVDTPEERAEAQALGWRTFMVVPFYEDHGTINQIHGRHEILCPATDPHPKRNATCATCLLCRGTSASAPSIWGSVAGHRISCRPWI